jgi:hypothetical protein
MPPYEAENAIANLAKVWIKERVDRLKGWVDRNLKQEVFLLHCWMLFSHYKLKPS